MHEDILIIGAGPSGLMAAFELAKHGRRALILEARDRIGGRAHTLATASAPHLELGAEFIHGELPITMLLLKEAGLDFTATSGKWIQVKGGATDSIDDGGDWSALMKKLNGLEEDMTLQDFLERHFSGTRYAALKDRAISFAEGYDSADASRVSAKALHQEWDKEQETQYRIDKGYSALMDHLADLCSVASTRILLSHPVSSVRMDDGNVSVEAAGESFKADKVIIALPLGVLQDGAIRLDVIPPHYTDALNRLGFGNVIKFVLRFRHAFWEAEYPDLGFLFSGAPIPTWWTQAPSQSPVLTGWMSGRSAKASKDLPQEQLLETAMLSLAQLFSRDREHLEAELVEARIGNWSADPYTLGAYAYATVGSEAARAILSQPISGRIFFAGEYQYDGPAMGTVEAAFQSGKETARRLLAAAAGER